MPVPVSCTEVLKENSQFQIMNRIVFISWIITLLGVCSFGVNIYVVIVATVHRKIVLKNIFYMLVLHCSTVDVMRAVALCIWCLPSLNLFSIDWVVWFTVIKKLDVVVLKCLNLLTIMNLFVFTVNEFLVVRKPLQYRKLRRKLIVLLFIGLSWVSSFALTVGSAVIKSHGTNSESVDVLQINDDEYEDPQEGSSKEFYYNFNQTFVECQVLMRNRLSSQAHNHPFHFIVIVLCLICLGIVIIFYALIFKAVNKFKNCAQLKIVSHSVRTVGCKGSDKLLKYVPLKQPSIASRHKHIIVIGSILVIDILFLIPYLILHLLQYIQLNHADTSIDFSIWLRLGLQILIGLHSVAQPFCYFRMKAFRQLATFKKVSSDAENTTAQNRSKTLNYVGQSIDFDFGTEMSSKKFLDDSPKCSLLKHAFDQSQTL